ncbi:hypothetical protein NLG97_g1292 [Lecanicillium saksenae]|uniref:Uncharacterized protein n=1 Tax=Lecanicillium saksenae TaxID=468837 RepID=A0ACC1R7L3_9HYPO|nr:hypothetical protein NLG97_g1292 [Lecanicillium saksenae]
MATAPAIEHSANWYENNVLDATPPELLAIEYVCCYYSNFLDTHDMPTAETRDDSASRQRQPDSIWLVNERKETILQLSRAHPMYTVLASRPLGCDKDDSHGLSPDDLGLHVLEYSAERMQKMIHAVRGDSDLQQASKVWWARMGGRPPDAPLARCVPFME